jgi:hypothetical protein
MDLQSMSYFVVAAAFGIGALAATEAARRLRAIRNAQEEVFVPEPLHIPKLKEYRSPKTYSSKTRSPRIEHIPKLSEYQSPSDTLSRTRKR